MRPITAGEFRADAFVMFGYASLSVYRGNLFNASVIAEGREHRPLDARGVHLLAGGIDQLFEVGVHPADHIVLEPIRAAAATSFQVKSLTRRASAAATLPVLHSSRCSPPRQHSSPVGRVAY
jgi:hypothetical protein